MKQSFRVAALVCSFVALVGAYGGETPTATDAVLQLMADEHAWAQAAVDGDIEKFSGYMSDGYEELYVVPATAKKNTVWGTSDKASWVALLRSKREKYASVKLRNLKVYLRGEIAIVTGEYSQKATSGGKDNSSSGLYVDTWMKTRGRWQLISSVFP